MPPTVDGEKTGYQAQSRYDSSQVLDRYLLAKTHDLITEFAEAMDGLDIWAACELVRSYLDMLTNWYVRRSRGGSGTGRQRHPRVLRRLLHLPRGLLPCRGPAAAVHGRRDLPRTHRGALRPPGRLPRRRGLPRRRRTSSPPWTSPATSARRHPRCARPTICVCGCRWRG
jgi:hypothetical protein